MEKEKEEEQQEQEARTEENDREEQKEQGQTALPHESASECEPAFGIADIVVCDCLAYPANMALIVRACSNAGVRSLYFVERADGPSALLPERFKMKKIVTANLRHNNKMALVVEYL